MTYDNVGLFHHCSCGDPQINHAHEFPELGCVCLTCGKGSNKPEEIVFDEDVVKGLLTLIELVEDPKTKTRFDHVRGIVEQKELMVIYLKRAIEIIKFKK